MIVHARLGVWLVFELLRYAITLSLLWSLSGCGASVLGVQADLVTGAAIVVADADGALVEARRHELDAVVEEARSTCGADGCDESEAIALRTERDRVTRRWASALACRGPVVEALRLWVGALDLARIASSEDVSLALLLRYAVGFVGLYAELVDCVGAASPSVRLPELPAALVALTGGES